MSELENCFQKESLSHKKIRTTELKKLIRHRFNRRTQGNQENQPVKDFKQTANSEIIKMKKCNA